MARRARLISLAALTAAVLTLGATAASAQQYPPSGPTVSGSVSGTTVTLTGSGWLPNSEISFEINPPLGSTTADATGSYSVTLQIPCSVGNGDHVITASGTGADGLPASTTTGITVTGCAGPAAATSTGPLAFTGSDSMPYVGIGVVAVLVGVVLTVIGVRRRGDRAGLQA